jgi:hypothetical protein
MYWVDTQDGRRCTRHNETFRRNEVCTRCVVDPGTPVSADDDEAPDPELEALYGEIRSRAKTLWRIGEDTMGDGTDRDVSAGCKAIAESTKLERFALEIRDRLTTKRDLATLIKKYRALVEADGGDAH